MAEEYASPNEPVRLLIGQLGYFSLHFLSHGKATELNKKFLVIDALISCRLDFESRYEIFLLDWLLLAVLLLGLG